MMKYTITIFILLSTIVSLMAQIQIPESFAFQGLVRDGNVLPPNPPIIYSNTTISVRFTIKDGTATGPIVYQEEHLNYLQTNDLGIFNAKIGAGTPVGTHNFSAIDWSSEKYLLIEIDPVANIPANYTLWDDAQILTAPYAFYAETTGQKYAVSDLTDVDVSSLQNGQTLVWDSNNQVWTPMNVLQYIAGTGIIIQNNSIAADHTNAIWNANAFNGIGVAVNPPSNNQVLQYNSASNQWMPQTLNLNNYTAGNGTLISGNTISAQTNSPLWNGNALQNIPVSSVFPTSSQVLTFDGTSWAPATLNLNTYSGGVGVNVSATNQISAQTTSPIWNAGTIQSIPITTNLPMADQVLKFNSVTGNFEYADDENTTYTAGNGISIGANGLISNTSPNIPITLTAGGATTITGTYPNITITSIDTDTDNQTLDLTNLSPSQRRISIKKGNNIINAVTVDINDADADPNNELQTLDLQGTQLRIMNGGTVTDFVNLPTTTVSAGFGLNNSGGQINLDNPLNSDWRITGVLRVGNPSGTASSGDILAGDDIVANDNISAGHDITAALGYIRAGFPSISYGNGDIAATSDVLADDNIISRGGSILAGSPSSAYGSRDIVAQSDVIADYDIRAGDDLFVEDNATIGDDVAIYGQLRIGNNIPYNGNFGVYDGDLEVEDEAFIGTFLYVRRDIHGRRDVFVDRNLRVNGSASSYSSTWNVISDKRLKDIKGTYSKGLKEIANLDVIEFKYKKDNPLGLLSEKQHIGFGAQDLQKVFPEAVQKTKDKNGHETDYWGININPVLMASINAIKELKTENDALKENLQALEERLHQLEQRH